MEKSDYSLLACMFGFIVMLVAVGWFTGKTLERKSLTAEFKKQVEAAYFQGLDDGRKMGFKEGLAAECEDEPHSGRY